MPDITVVTRDDIRLTFPCATSATVLDAAEEAGYYLPSVCHHGRCGTCWARVVAGRFELAPYITAALPPTPGSVLLCRCRPREDLLVELPCRDAQVGRRHVPERRAVVEAVAPPGAAWAGLALQLLPDAEYGQAAAFTPGQAMELRIPGSNMHHSLTMANAPNEAGRLEFLARPEPGSAFAAWLGAARRGAAVDVRGPAGRFALDETSPRPRCFAGAGGGLAPLLAMLRHLAERRDRTRMQLIFAANPSEMSFLEKTLAFLRTALPQLSVTLVPDCPTVMAEVLDAHLARGPRPDIYASGPPPMLEAVLAAGDARGMPAGQIRTSVETG
ncbi:2Fe-2S iron-sulfur cluster binding domain-containing protein [Acidocella sp.]|uniref:2Fe-2S iron-sulfur cluster binding domain-containing protein n=1 Tax=Acidocella sp. TaxID=50710 RepID=UPI00260A7BD9|nr:2Fe-2S iron-sulfur cluster binding domain-containing protein [Acidocella sp.]